MNEHKQNDVAKSAASADAKVAVEQASAAEAKAKTRVGELESALKAKAVEAAGVVVKKKKKKDKSILNAAIFRAQSKVRALGADATHEFGFTYTRGDTIVDHARKALHDEGCLVRRKKWTVDFSANTLAPQVHVDFEILHVESGQRLRETVPWFFVVRGGAADKAVAAALIGCFGYWLLGQLAIPRSKDEAAGVDMDERVNEKEKQEREQKAQQAHHEQQARDTQAHWLASAARWKSDAFNVSKDTKMAPTERINALHVLQRQALLNPLGPTNDARFPDKIAAKLSAYFDRFRAAVQAEADGDGAEAAKTVEDSPESERAQDGTIAAEREAEAIDAEQTVSEEAGQPSESPGES